MAVTVRGPQGSVLLGPLREAGEETPQIVPQGHLCPTPRCSSLRVTVAGGDLIQTEKGVQVVGVGSPQPVQERPPAAAGEFRWAEGAWSKEATQP